MSLEQESLYEHFSFKADKGQSPLRVDKFLMNFLENTTRNKIQNAAKAGNIWVNKTPVKSNHKVKALDLVQILLSFPPREKYKIVAQKLPLDIIYEDDNILIVNKSPNMVVHPGCANYSGTLVHGLKYHFGEVSALDDSIRPGLVHRIDKDTSGLLVIAKDEYSLEYLSRQFFLRTIKRNYLALTWGNLKEDKGIIRGNIGRSLKCRKKMQVFPLGDKGKHAITHYEVLERFGLFTFISCRLETGRTHQIRAHLSYIGHPLFNDKVYGGNLFFKNYPKYHSFLLNCFSLLPRQALHAHSLGFIHPKTKKEMYFEAPLPKDMNDVLHKWRSLNEANFFDK